MAANDVDMRDRAKAPLPTKVQVLIDPVNPLANFFGSIPGFHNEIKVPEKENEAKFMDVRKLVAVTDLLKSKYPQYDYSIKEVKARSVRRLGIDVKISTEDAKYNAKVAALQTAYLQTMRNLKREKQLLDQLEQIDDNLLVIDKELEESNKALNATAYKKAKRERLASEKEEREEAYAETLARQDARRRKSYAGSMPNLLHEGQQPVNAEYDAAQYSAASA